MNIKTVLFAFLFQAEMIVLAAILDLFLALFRLANMPISTFNTEIVCTQMPHLAFMAILRLQA